MINVLLAFWPMLLSEEFISFYTKFPDPKVYVYVMTLGNLNSCVNPWIYIMFNRGHVKKAFQRCRPPGTPG